MKTLRKTSTSKRTIFFCAALAATGFLSIHSWAAFVTPTQVYIESGQRASEVIVSNQSNAPKMITFEWERRAMLEGGKVVRLREGDEAPANYKPADEYLRFSPRRTILKAKETQKIRIIARKPPNLEDGEYHSHLLIKQNELPKKPTQEVVPDDVLTGKIGFRVYNSIPVFLRHGTTKVDLKITETSIEKTEGKRMLKITVQNNSTRSIYPYVNLVCGTETTRIGSIKTYPEASRIEGSYNIDKINPSTCSNPRVQLIGTEDFELNNQVISEQSTKL